MIERVRAIHLPSPMAHQVPILLDDSRFKMVLCGRRWGKTLMALTCALQGHGPRMGRFKGAAQGGRIWWVVPDYTTMDNSYIWEYLKHATRFVATPQEVKHLVRLPGGGSVQIRSADDPNRLRGAGLDGVVFDEAAFSSVRTWHESIRPALSDRKGWAVLPTTPMGKNWYWKLWCKCKDWDEWGRWQRPTADNPTIAKSELESVKDEMGPTRFAQEYMAIPSEIEGALFGPQCFDEETIWAGDEWPDDFARGVIAVDPSMGGDRSDYCAIVFLGVAKGLLWVDCTIDRRSPEAIVQGTYEMARRYPVECVGIEANGFQSVLGIVFRNYAERESLEPLPIRMITNSEKKELRVARLEVPLANQDIRFRSGSAHCLELVEQLQMFPERAFHDDGPDALEMAHRLIYGLTQRSMSRESDDQVAVT